MKGRHLCRPFALDAMTTPAYASPQLAGLAGRLPHGLDRTLLAMFLKSAASVEVAQGGLLYAKGDKAQRFAWLEDGLAELFVTDGDGNELQLDLAARGAMLGDIAAATDGVHITSARALTPLKLRWIDAREFRDQLARDGLMALGTLASLGLRLGRLVGQLEDIKLKSATRRLAGFLLELAGRSDGKAQVALPFEKKTLARHLGITSQSLSRSLKALGELGVTVKGRHFFLADCRRLADYREQEGEEQ